MSSGRISSPIRNTAAWSIRTTDGLLDLPLPQLIGRHQIENAAVAIAALRHAGRGWGKDAAIEHGLAHGGMAGAAAAPDARARWSTSRPRVRRSGSTAGTIRMAPRRSRRAIADLEERARTPLYLICGMLKTKDARRISLAPSAGSRAMSRRSTFPAKRRASAPASSTIARAPRPRCRAGRRSRRRDAAGLRLGARASRRNRRRASSSAARSIWRARCWRRIRKRRSLPSPDIARTRHRPSCAPRLPC